ncbi:hypothetical protein RXV86_04310 [Alisedimentitalea sp. MJ-SS2]|uniref:hypothetical protein n=1 Tax=Aliisedimentitalea sp. MJ-SS2 TaxID=3049795 RepID=UPI0029111BE9|nr:hypothetical protein [Alisedimentitalea sp. MJ-SS2]MDU8926601.1 hypothetical protein [Alisedimentitalea sp. MJ-SS2]
MVIVLLATMLGLLAQMALSEVPKRNVYVFWQEGCPHCARAMDGLARTEVETGDFRLAPIELGMSKDNDALFHEVIRQMGADCAAVPLVVVGLIIPSALPAAACRSIGIVN